MATHKWDGTERRRHKQETDGTTQEGRRITDWHCGDHAIIQETTRDHRAIVCGKIETLKRDHEGDFETIHREVSDLQKSIVGRWAFGLILLTMVGIICSVNGYLIHKIDAGQEKTERNFKELDVTLSNMATLQAVTAEKISKIEERNHRIDAQVAR